MATSTASSNRSPSLTVTATSAPIVFIPLHLKLAVGGVAGVVGVSSTFPVDIVKTQLQGHTRRFAHGPLQIVRHIYTTEGLRGFYRGLPPTLVGVLPEKAIKLAVNDQLREYFQHRNGNSTGILPLGQQILAAAGAGIAQVIATNPTEIVKIRLQTQASLPVAEQLTPLQVVQSLGLRGLYKGVDICLLRDIPYSIIFFPTYAALRDALASEKNDSSTSSSMLSTLFAGAVAGATAAGLCTPADVIKTRRQMRGANYKNTLDCYRQIVAKDGYGALMRGAVPRMMVQAPLLGITLLAFEMQKKYMLAKQHE